MQYYYRDPAGLFRDAGFCHFYRLDIRKVDFKIAGNGMGYTHGTQNIFLFYAINGKDMIWSRDLGTNDSGNIKKSTNTYQEPFRKWQNILCNHNWNLIAPHPQLAKIEFWPKTPLALNIYILATY